MSIKNSTKAMIQEVVMKEVVTIDAIQQKILLIRGQRVMIDADLAAIYGVTTKRQNEQVKR